MGAAVTAAKVGLAVVATFWSRVIETLPRVSVLWESVMAAVSM